MKKLSMALAGLIFTAVALAQTISIDAVLEIASTLGVFDTSTHPFLEQAEEGEADNIKKIAVSMFKTQVSKEPQSRDAHAKGHACAMATMTVEASVPEELQVGLFANPSATYQALIRYSNGSNITKADGIPDGRGMAIKVIDGAKDGNILGTGTTQDFMLINNPRFFVKSIRDYALFASVVENLKEGEQPERFFIFRALREAITESGAADGETVSDENIIKLAIGVAQFTSNPIIMGQALGEIFGLKAGLVGGHIGAKLFDLKNGKAPLEMRIVMETLKIPGSLVTEPYFSMSSYLAKSKNGPEADTAIKYVTQPVDCESGDGLAPLPKPEILSENYLREELLGALASKDICYNFYLQPLPANIDSALRKTLVEDSRLDYNTNPVLVAKIKISKGQDNGSDAKKAYCENLSFNPWQAAPELRPVGAMNRARKLAVTASSIRRHLETGGQRLEPTTVKDFENIK